MADIDRLLAEITVRVRPKVEEGEFVREMGRLSKKLQVRARVWVDPAPMTKARRELETLRQWLAQSITVRPIVDTSEVASRIASISGQIIPIRIVPTIAPVVTRQVERVLAGIRAPIVPPPPTTPRFALPYVPPARLPALPYIPEEQPGRPSAAAAAATRSAIDAALEAMEATLSERVPSILLEYAASLVDTGKLTVQQAADALRIGFTRSAAVLRELGNEAVGASARFGSLNNALRTIGEVARGEIAGPTIRQLRNTSNEFRALVAAAAVASREMSSVGAAAATTYMPLRQLQTLIRQGLAAEGLQAAGANVSLAARFVQSGLISLDDAIRALALGVQYPNKVMKEMGVTAKTAAQSLREMVKQIVGVGTTAGGAVPPSIVPPGGALLGGLPEPGRVLALSEALNTTRKSTAGLMQSLLSLRWQIFTVMFFFYMLSNAASSAWSRLQGGARIIDQVRTGLALLSAIGIKNAIELGRQIQEASGYTMSFAEIIGVMARSAIRGVSAEVVKLVPQLMRYAQLLSIITGGAETSEQVLTKMLEAIQRGQVRLAVTVGATSGSMTNILEIFKRTADEAKNAEGPVGELTRMLLDTGIMAAKGAESLTPWQKQLLVAWQIVQLAEQAVGGMGDEFDATSRKINTFSRALEEVGKAIWTSITNAFAPISQELGRFIYAIAGAFVVWKELFGAMLDYMATGGAEEHLRRIDAVVQEYQQTVREVSTSTIPTLKDAYIGLARFGQLKVFATQAQDGEKMVEVNKSALDSLMKILGMTTNLTEAEEERSRGIAEQSELMIQSLKSYMDYLLEVEREEQDIARRRARDWEDLEIERRRKIEDIERSFAKEREQAQRQYDDRRQEAQRDLARRLAQIERDLANKLRDIWRDYNDKLFEATAERNAIMALMAQRERDRRIQEAYEWAADARQTAYEQYQDTVENERRQLEDRLRQIADNRAQEYEELRIWYERRRQDMLLAYAREDEDARIARERRMADLMRQYQWELVQHRVKNDQLLTQEQRYLQLALALRNMYEQLIGKPIVIPVYLQHYSLPSLPREPVTGQRPRARMAGGVDIVTRPTLFLAHPGEAVATVPMYRASPLPVSVDGTVRHSVRAMVDARVAGMEGRIANAVMLALANVFRRA